MARHFAVIIESLLTYFRLRALTYIELCTNIKHNVFSIIYRGGNRPGQPKIIVCAGRATEIGFS